MQNDRPKDLVSIQFLRGIAASMVVFHHALGQFASIHAMLPTEEGAMGVDLFFVISGFVMTYTTNNSERSAKAFLRRRAIRILPLYWVMTALVAILLIFGAGLVNNSAFTLESFALSLLFIPHENPGMLGSLTPMLKLGWTLNYEVFFYLVFACVIWLRPALRVLVMALFFGVVVGLAYVAPIEWPPLAFWGDTILFEFLFGCGIAILFMDGALARVPRIVWFGVLALALLVMGFVGFAPQPGPWRFLQYGVPTALLLMSVVALDQSSKIAWGNGPLRFLGDASYSIYLAHLYVVIAFRILWQRLDLTADTLLSALLFVGACVAIGIAAGAFTYIFIERPVTNWVRGWAKPKRAEAIA